ncbi:helix-turn-helix transcriptional regulator [Nocardia elegans]|uniref:Helix-turn-helix domain-containing protein n=1 Tax=Nocardia elegans TaxID=300029 RepID=A0ABW6TQC2_9NOCA|nr:helix-turn-helix domain-containing protein [Nocardia elegans]MBF6446624.1 helix-turn-helix transcriptional regulator [Nocardia elegans]
MAASRTHEAKRIAVIIQKRRKDLGLTRSDLARRTGLANSSILRLEEGSFAHPSPRSLKAIADGLEMPVDILLHEAGWMPKAERPTDRPHIAITYHRVPDDVARHIQARVNMMVKRSAAGIDIYHEAINRNSDPPA